MHRISVSLFRGKVFNDSLFYVQCKCNKTNWIAAKKGFLLNKMISVKDKKKNWHFNILNNKPKCRNVFEKIHKPSKRQNVLNTLFIRNITDVMSTGDIVPEILGYGIEISGVKISPCCKYLNVFWQVPVGKSEEYSEKLSKLLCEAGPKIRAELISRNVIGRVPVILFLRDCTNARVAAFEDALKNLDVGSNADSCTTISDDIFSKNIFSFKTPKIKEKFVVPTTENEKKVLPPGLQNPLDMKSDVFGLNHGVMMEKVIASKKKRKNPQQSAIISPENWKEGDDLFSKIPGICFQTDTNRDKLLKQFQVERKMLMQKKDINLSEDDYSNYEAEDDYSNYEVEDDNVESEYNSHLDDFFDEDNRENSEQ